MIELLIKILDRLIQLRKYKKESHVIAFKEILEPSFKDLETIHSDYLSNFNQLANNIKKYYGLSQHWFDDEEMFFIESCFNEIFKSNDKHHPLIPFYSAPESKLIELLRRFFKDLISQNDCINGIQHMDLFLEDETTFIWKIYSDTLEFQKKFEPVRAKYKSFINNTFKEKVVVSSIPVIFHDYIVAISEYFPDGNVMPDPLTGRRSFYSNFLAYLDSLLDRKIICTLNIPGDRVLQLGLLVFCRIWELQKRWEIICDEYNKIRIQVFTNG